ncbi:MAG: hypothetical protein KGJ89_00800 [Patescibacteria group bacterium]|nr:hypothetical protein [Patescibacteria group bacterium]MDE2015052.1 hypothetical protein [Patescibacteria group bacterium]MDE2226480.1 hypothetical protein [Patescibacteria group bacterium]
MFNNILNLAGRFFVRFGEWLIGGKAQAVAASEAEAEQPEVTTTAQEPPTRHLDIQAVSTDPKTDIAPDPFTVDIPYNDIALAIGMPTWEMRDEVNPLLLRQSASASASAGQGAKPPADAQAEAGRQESSSPSGTALPRISIPAPKAKPIPAALRGIIAGGAKSDPSGTSSQELPATESAPPAPRSNDTTKPIDLLPRANPTNPPSDSGTITVTPQVFAPVPRLEVPKDGYRPSWQGPRPK